MTPVAGVERRPSSGSCVICHAALGLASVKAGGVWDCSTACAEGRPSGEERYSVVPEAWLYPVPRRFYGKRRPIKRLSKKPSSSTPERGLSHYQLYLTESVLLGPAKTPPLSPSSDDLQFTLALEQTGISSHPWKTRRTCGAASMALRSRAGATRRYAKARRHSSSCSARCRPMGSSSGRPTASSAAFERFDA